VGDDVPIDSETLFITNFVNLKIKPAQSFRGIHRSMVYIRVFIRLIAHIYISICVCIVFLEGNRLANLLFSWNSECVSRAGTQDRTPKSRLKKRLATYCIDVSREAT
jgi:hypothetical protein